MSWEVNQKVPKDLLFDCFQLVGRFIWKTDLNFKSAVKKGRSKNLEPGQYLLSIFKFL